MVLRLLKTSLSLTKGKQMINLANKKNRLLKYIFLISVFCLSLALTENKKEEGKSFLNVLDLKCEYTSDPIGLDIQTPQLSWRIESEKKGTIQTAYEVLIADSLKELNKNIASVWSSGIIKSSKSTGIIYNGDKLISRTRYYWKVRIWDSNNIASDWSKSAFFEMGLLNQEDWKGIWAGFTPGLKGGVLYFKKTFNIEKNVKQARVYISGLGYYVLNLNGKKVGDCVLDPATSNYYKKIYYSTFDVTEFLKNQNAMVITLGTGWYGIPKLRMQLEITFVDGTTTTITSDDVRSVTTGPIVKSNIYDGEYYDAREEDPEIYSTTPINVQNKKWGYGQYVEPPGGNMVSQKVEPIKVVDTITPQKITEPKPGVYIVDNGQNIAGWASLKVKGERGRIITLKFAESLYKDGTVNQENLRTAEAKDTYILKGGGEEERWEPSFTYHGFRYIQVEGFPYPLKADDIQIKVVRSSVRQVGKFTCSNELLNRIHKMVSRTEASNLYSVPTDCPQRDERMGWLNDLTVRIEEAIYNFDLSRFYAKYIADIGDEQGKDGSITDTAPFKYGARPADPVSASYLLLAWKSYEFYGNEEIIRQNYDGLKAWVTYLISRTKEGIVDYSYYGDWSPPLEFGEGIYGANSKFTPGLLMSTGYLYYDCKIISQMAHILGNKSDEVYFENMAEKTATAFNNKYWNEQLGGYGSNNQACNSFALFIGLVNKERIVRVVDNIVKDVKDRNYHLTTGNLCTKYLLEALTKYGHPNVAFKIATQETYPSWGYMMANGATTLWERWEGNGNGAMNSLNHPMMGSVDSWFYKYILGIIPDITKPGFEDFSIHPYVINDLDSAAGELNTVKGVIKSAWKKAHGSFYLEVTVPENSTATIYVPTKNVKSITESNKKIDEAAGIKFLNTQDDYAVFQVGSGKYQFKSDW
jgi:alpha-L-rhamnosidase